MVFVFVFFFLFLNFFKNWAKRFLLLHFIIFKFIHSLIHFTYSPISIIFFCDDGRGGGHQSPDSVYPFIKISNQLRIKSKQWSMSLLFLLLRGLKHTRKKTRANKSINITKVVIQDKTWPCSPYIYIYFIVHYITIFEPSKINN